MEDVIETFESGNKKVYVRYHPDSNVLEKHFYNAAGEMIYLERDSLSKEYYFKKFMMGTWIMEKMTVDEEIVFEMDTIFNPENPPNIYTFSSKYLKVSGPQYSANYKIAYKDSSQVELDGKWTYGVEGENTYRTKRIYKIKYFEKLSVDKHYPRGISEYILLIITKWVLSLSSQSQCSHIAKLAFVVVTKRSIHEGELHCSPTAER